MVTEKVAKPIQALRIEQGTYYTQIYLGDTLLFSIHHVAREYADSGEKLEGTAKFYITESGIADILVPVNNRNFSTRKTAVKVCLGALRDFRADLCQLDL